MILNLFIILSIIGWVIGLIILIILAVKTIRKRYRIKYLYQYNRHWSDIIIDINLSSISESKEFTINDSIRCINFKYINRILNIPYIGVPVDNSEAMTYRDLCNRGGFGGSGGSELVNRYGILNSSLNQYVITSYPDIYFKDPNKKIYISNISINTHIFIESREAFDIISGMLLSDGIFYIVSDISIAYDYAFCSIDGKRSKINIDDLEFLIRNSNSFSKITFDQEVEAKRKSNYKIFKNANLYLRNESVI